MKFKITVVCKKVCMEKIASQINREDSQLFPVGQKRMWKYGFVILELAAGSGEQKLTIIEINA